MQVSYRRSPAIIFNLFFFQVGKVAVGLLETTYPNAGARIIIFTGGPAAEGSRRSSVMSRRNLDNHIMKSKGIM